MFRLCVPLWFTLMEQGWYVVHGAGVAWGKPALVFVRQAPRVSMPKSDREGIKANACFRPIADIRSGSLSEDALPVLDDMHRKVRDGDHGTQAFPCPEATTSPMLWRPGKLPC